MGNTALKNKAKVEAYKNSLKRKGKFDSGCYLGAMNAAIIMLYVMHNDFGYGKKRLKRIYNRIADLSELYMAESEGDEQVKVSELAEVLKEECGIDIDLKKGILRFPPLDNEPGANAFQLR